LLGYNSNKNLTRVNQATVQNLITYLQNYRILTDRVNIIDGYIINIGVEFKITVFRGFNKSEVLKNCITSIKNFFNIDNWSFNQPINLSQINFEIMQNEGVQSVTDITIKNLTIDDGNYSEIAYDINLATQNNIVYPSKDPSVFEVKYPDSDIKGIVVSL
jgi:phage-related baseplate assembly protein